MDSAIQTKIHNTYGSAFVGLIVSSMLYGITNLQVLLYFKKCIKGVSVFKYLVFFIWLLDSAHLGLSSATIYGYIVTNFGDPDALLKPNWCMKIQLDISSATCSIVHCFFAYHLWILTKNRVLPVLVLFLSFVYLGFTVASSFKTFKLNETNEIEKYVWVNSIALASSSAANFIVCGSIFRYHLSDRSSFFRTESTLTALVITGLTSGLFISILAITTLSLYIPHPGNLAWLAVSWISAKMHVNSFLAVLNTQRYGGHTRKSLSHIPREIQFRTDIIGRNNTGGHLTPNNGGGTGGESGESGFGGSSNKFFGLGKQNPSSVTLPSVPAMLVQMRKSVGV